MRKLIWQSKSMVEKALKTLINKGAIYIQVWSQLNESRPSMVHSTKDSVLFKKRMTRMSAWWPTRLMKIALAPLIQWKMNYFYRKTLSSVKLRDRVTLVKNLPRISARELNLEKVTSWAKIPTNCPSSLINSVRIKALAIRLIQTIVIKSHPCKAETYLSGAFSCQISYLHMLNITAFKCLKSRTSRLPQRRQPSRRREKLETSSRTLTIAKPAGSVAQ